MLIFNIVGFKTREVCLMSANDFLNCKMKLSQILIIALVFVSSSCLKLDNETSDSSGNNSSPKDITSKQISNGLKLLKYSNVDAKSLVEQYPSMKSLNVFSPGVFSYSYSREEIDSGKNIISRNDPGKNVYLKITLDNGLVLKRRLK